MSFSGVDGTVLAPGVANVDWVGCINAIKETFSFLSRYIYMMNINGKILITTSTRGSLAKKKDNVFA